MDSDDDALDEILNRPSSPIHPPPNDSESNTPASPSGAVNDHHMGLEPSDPTSPIDPCITPSNPRKRPAEDFTQLAGTVSRKIKLNPADRAAMTRFSEASPEEQNLLTYGQLLRLSTQLAAIHPPDVAYTIPTILKNKIAKHSARSVLSTVSAYKADNVPLKLIQAVLLKYPAWGYTKAVKTDKVKSSIINKAIQKDLTEIRHDAKKTIGDSIWLATPPKAKRTFEKRKDPQDIIALCESLISMPCVKGANIVMDLDMLGRVALLRTVLVVYPDESYWEKVDKRLLKIRTTAKNDAAEISKSISKLLAADQASYGPVNLEALRGVIPPADDDDEADEQL